MNQENILNNKSQTQEEIKPAESLEEYLATHQQQWSSLVTELNQKMKKFSDLPELQMTVYSSRQNALDYYFNLLSQVSSMSKEYKKQYATKYNAYKINSQIRYSSEASINAQIASDLSDYVHQITLIENHAKFMQETIKTIDNIIFGISNRIRIEEIIQGVK